MSGPRSQSPDGACDEQALIGRAVGGDDDALSTLLERHAPQIRRDLRVEGHWLSRFDVDDVMQVTFYEAFLNISRFDPHARGSFVNWLLRIARNNLRDLIKEAGRAKRPPPARRVHRVGGGDSCETLIDILSGTTGATPSRHAAAAESRRALESAIEQLPEKYRRVVVLYDLELKNAEEVGAAIGRTPGAVYMLRARAHDRLREVLGSQSRFFSRGA